MLRAIFYVESTRMPIPKGPAESAEQTEPTDRDILTNYHPSLSSRMYHLFISMLLDPADPSPSPDSGRQKGIMSSRKRPNNKQPTPRSEKTKQARNPIVLSHPITLRENCCLVMPAIQISEFSSVLSCHTPAFRRFFVLFVVIFS